MLQQDLGQHHNNNSSSSSVGVKHGHMRLGSLSRHVVIVYVNLRCGASSISAMVPVISGMKGLHASLWGPGAQFQQKASNPLHYSILTFLRHSGTSLGCKSELAIVLRCSRHSCQWHV